MCRCSVHCALHTTRDIIKQIAVFADIKIEHRFHFQEYIENIHMYVYVYLHYVNDVYDGCGIHMQIMLVINFNTRRQK